MSGRLYKIDELPQALSQLHRKVSRWKFTPALIELSKLSWAVGGPNVGPQAEQFLKWRDRHLQDIGYLAKVVVCRCHPHRGIGPSQTEICKAIDESLEASEAPKGLDEDSLAASFNRIAAAQWWLRQCDSQEQIVRTWMLFSQIPKRPEVAVDLRLDWNDEFQAISGFTPQDLLDIFAGFYVPYRGGIRHRGHLVAGLDTTPYDEAQIDKFLAAFSIDRTQFTTLTAERQHVPPEREYYGFNPLQEFPLVRVGHAKYVIPSRPHFIYALTSGVFWKVRNKLADVADPRKNPANQDLGLFLEAYARDLMEHYLDAEGFVPEIEYKGGKWADAAILRDTEGIIIECKAHGFSLDVLGTGDLAALEKELEKNVIPALRQAAKNVRHAEQAARTEPRLRGITSWFPLVVLHEAWLPLDSAAVRKRVLNKLDSQDRELVNHYEVATIREFEYMMGSARAIHPVDMMKKKVEHAPTWPMWKFIDKELKAVSGETDSSFFDKAFEEILRQFKAKYAK